MRRLAAYAALLAALLASACGPPDVQRPEALVGRWSGRISWHDATTPVALAIARDGDSLAVRYSAPELFEGERAAGRLSYDAPRVHFVVTDSLGAHAFDGWLRRDLVVGTFAVAGIEANPSRLPQVALRRDEARRRRSPWPDSAVAPPPAPPPRPGGSLGAWLRELASR